ncbi:hypothetical protein D9758_002682 [Tetrapyrgos nigripes]|uniref:Uncharacterized protein n=1 Tax=Tetrapyrgos nigripes TaxID=182062 RepID=A0A8H5GQW7_9AGAR|nr:hypothetical protein D9758_002682 [Tetrapyrgos nigripes]
MSHQVRNHMQELSETLRQTEIAEAPSVQAIADEEEKRVEDLREQIAECLKRLHQKEVLTARKARMRLPSPSKKLAVDYSSRKPPPSKEDRAEEEFWNTPSNKGRTFVLNDNLLMDEEADFGDMSVASFASPIPAPQSRFAADLEDEAEGETPPDSPTQRVKVPPRSPTPQPELPTTPPETTLEEASAQPSDPPPREAKEPKPHINVETERIAAKMWATVGDIIMPGNLFSTAPGKEKPPEAKATIAHLRYLSSLTPVPASPVQSVSSLSTAARANAPPTPQQILTATLLFALLSAPGHSLSLNKVKEVITAKASTSGSAAMVAGHTRILYGCVAKRLLKIDRDLGSRLSNSIYDICMIPCCVWD